MKPAWWRRLPRPAWWRRSSILVRLTLVYSIVSGAITLALGLFVYGIIEHRLHAVLDRELDVDLDFIEARLEPGGRSLRHAGRDDPRLSSGTVRPTAWFEVWTGNEELLLRQWPAKRRDQPAFLRPPRRGRVRAYSAIMPDGTPLRVLERKAVGSDLLLRVYRNEAALVRTLRQILFGFVLASPIAALLAAVGGYSMARQSLAPVGAMAERARRITSESLSQRLPAPNPHDELGQLAEVFNDTLQRLENSFTALRRFTADASHELRTPLTALRTVGEVAVQEARDADELREAVGSMLEEAARLDDILEALLTLARAEGGDVAARAEAIDVASLLSEIRASLSVLAAERGQNVQVSCSGDVVAKANRSLLRQAVMNLLHNAIRHGLDDSVIRLAGRRADGEVVIEVTDQGPGIAAEHQQRIFERFFRLDKARSRAEGGVGLGLAITKLFVEQQGGEIQLESAPGAGSTFRVLLPAA
ncbi:MAG TPA: ATP-binding protein [Candidatus Limnocylindrales bacterium]|nr:ATP-binding protein [Candidatus Limnocylindrales bacterium]